LQSEESRPSQLKKTYAGNIKAAPLADKKAATGLTG